MNRWTLLLLSSLLAACASAPPAQRETRFFHDRLFAAPAERIGADDLFVASADMKRFIGEAIAEPARVKGRHGNPQEAEQVLSHVLEREPRNTQVMSNLIPVLNDLGRVEAAQRLAARLEALDPDPPFSHFNRGMAAMRAGDPKTARDEFARELARAPDYHEFHFWLGIAYLNLGEIKPARTHLTLAMQNSTTRRDHDLYAAKLARINEPH